MEAAKHLILRGGAQMPKIGFGTWNLDSGEKGIDVLKHAIKIGYRHFDTAMLNNSEKPVGKAVKDSIDSGATSRTDFFITTKVWPTKYDNVASALDISLKKLETDYVDLFLLHFPIPPLDKTKKNFARLPFSNVWA